MSNNFPINQFKIKKKKFLLNFSSIWHQILKSFDKKHKDHTVVSIFKRVITKKILVLIFSDLIM